MSKIDITSKLIEQDKHPTMDNNDDDNGVIKALFIDTDIDTHFVLPVSSLFTVFSLKREICLEHYKLFPEFGKIEVQSVLMKLNGYFYHLADSMLLKTVFHGVEDNWIVFVDVLTPDLPHNHLGYNQVEPSPEVPCEFKCIEPCSQQHDESKHVIPFSKRDEFQGMSCKEQKTKNNQIVTDDVSKIGLNVMVNDTPIFLKEQQLNEKTRGWEWSAQTKGDHINNPSEGHHNTSGVHPPSKFQKNGGENVFKNFEDGGNTNVSDNRNKGGIDDIELPIGVQVKKSRKRKKSDTDTSAVSQSHAVTAPQGTDIPELSSHPDPLNLEREIEENSTVSNLSNTAKKRKTNESKKENRNNNKKASPLHLDNALELLSSHHEPLNLTDKEKEIEEDVGPFKPGNTAKKIKNKKSKNSGIKNLGNDHNAEPEDTSRPEESVETMSIMLNETRSRKDVPEDPLGSPVEVQLDEGNREMGPSTTIIQNDKRKKRNKKQPVTVLDSSSLLVNQQLKGMNTTEKVKQVDGESNDESLLVERQKETKEDVPSKSENTSRKKKNIKAKGSGMEAQDLSRKMENDDQNGYNALNTHGDLLFQDAVIRPEESVETLSLKVKKSSRTKKIFSANDPPKSLVEEKSDDTARETATPISVVPSDKPMKRGKNKQHVLSQDLSSLPANQQHLGGTMMEIDAPKIGEKMEGMLVNGDTNDTRLKSDTISNKRKTNDSEEESGRIADVSAPLLNDVQKQFFEHEPLNLVEREKQIQEDDTSKSDRTAKKKKNSKAKSSATEIQELPSKRPEESAETMSGKLKKSQNTDDILHKDPHDSALKKQVDEETMELVVPITVIQSDEAKKRKQKKQSVPLKDLHSVNLHVEEAQLEMVATRSVEQDDLMANYDKDDEVDQSKVMHDEGHQDELSEIPLQQVSSDFKHMKKSQTSKHKAKELNQASSIDTLSSGHNLVESKDIDGAKTKLHEHNESRPPLMESLVSQTDPINSGDVVDHASVNKASRVSGANFATETDSSKRVELADVLLTDSKSRDGQNGREMTKSEDDHVQFSQAPHLKVSPILPEASQLEKPRVSKKTKKVDPPSSIDMSCNGHGLVGSKKNRISTETSGLQKSMTNQKHDKSIPSLNAKSSTIQKEAIDTRIPLADAAKTPRKSGVFSRSAGDGNESSEASSSKSGNTLFGIREKMNIKQPPKKMETMNANHRRSSHMSGKEVVNTPVQKKGLLASSEAIFDASSSSSEDEDYTNASSSSTTIAPDNSSSSDYSEGESKSVGKSKYDSPKGNGKSAYSSGFKLESVLRSSSRYRKAKLVASQTEDESQPLEFVPDSQADM